MDETHDVLNRERLQISHEFNREMTRSHDQRTPSWCVLFFSNLKCEVLSLCAIPYAAGSAFLWLPQEPARGVRRAA